MSIRTQDVGRISLHDSLNREVPTYATPEAIQAQIAAFKAAGGVEQQIPAGVTAYTLKSYANAQLRKQRGEYISAMARKPKQHSQIKLKGSKS